MRQNNKASTVTPPLNTTMLYCAIDFINYSLFGVLLAAIERDILIACAPQDIVTYPWHIGLEARHSPGHVVTENLDAKYPRQAFAPAPKHVGEDLVRVQGWGLYINAAKELRWESYVKAGYY